MTSCIHMIDRTGADTTFFTSLAQSCAYPERRNSPSRQDQEPARLGHPRLAGEHRYLDLPSLLRTNTLRARPRSISPIAIQWLCSDYSGIGRKEIPHTKKTPSTRRPNYLIINEREKECTH
ncbi:hypothetical protein [Nitrospira sp. M1]